MADRLKGSTLWLVLSSRLAGLLAQWEPTGGADDQVGIVAVVQVSVTAETDQAGITAQPVH